MFSLLKWILKKVIKLGSWAALLGFMWIVGTAFIFMTPKIYESSFLAVHGQNVMFIETVDQKGAAGHGTGFHVTNSKGEQFLLTAKHICIDPDGPVSFKVYDTDGKEYQTEIVRVSKTRDLCLLAPVGKFDSFSLTTEFNQITSLFEIGYPLDFPQTITSGGIVGMVPNEDSFPSSKEECTDGGVYTPETKNITLLGLLNIAVDAATCTYSYAQLQTSILTRPGNSGGPVLTVTGDVVGIVSKEEIASMGRIIISQDIINFIEGK